MAYISRDTLLEIKRACDIVEVVSSYFPLQRSGANAKALCPFHEEKTPSFNVNPARQLFKCFGCGKSGGVIDFIMEIENLDFPGAVKLLADRAGIPVRLDGTTPRDRKREKVFEALRWASDLYHQNLLKAPEAHPAWRFLKKKGVTLETVRVFRLGLAPAGWDGLLREAGKDGFTEAHLLDAGLVKRGRQGSFYDFFRNRLMVPVFDTAGRVISFGGRTLSGTEKAKYINGPETAVFRKSRTLFGIHLLKGLPKDAPVTVVEGYFDVIVPHQRGVAGLVATLGTALTREHLSILRRYTSRVNLLFDSDEAGRRASNRVWGMLFGLVLNGTVDLQVCCLPAGKDPDEVPPEELRAILEERREIVDIAAQELSRRHDLGTLRGRMALIDELLEAVASVDAIESTATHRQDQLLAWISDRYSTSLSALKRRLSDLRRSRRSGKLPKPSGRPKRDPEETISVELLAALLSSPVLAREVPLDQLPSRDVRAVVEKIRELVDLEREFDASDLLALFPSEKGCRDLVLRAAARAVELEDQEEDEMDPRACLLQCLEASRRLKEQADRLDLREKLRAGGDEAVARAYEESLRRGKGMYKEGK